MYIPSYNREDDQATLHAFMQEYSFAPVITQQEGRIVATHIPLTLEPQQGVHGTLYGHLALGNQQWRTLDGSQEALVLFQGPHAYISASWYEKPLATVSTWNYAVVHAYGVPHRMDRETLLAHLLKLTQTLEASVEGSWSFEQGRETVEKLLPGVVGFVLPITRLEGKFKLSQNRPERDQDRVIESLESMSDPLADMMKTYLKKRDDPAQQR